MDKNTTEIRIYAKQKLNIIAGSRYRIGHKINVAENNPVKISLISLYFVDKTTTTLKLGTVRQMCCGLYFSINTFQFNTSKFMVELIIGFQIMKLIHLLPCALESYLLTTLIHTK